MLRLRSVRVESKLDFASIQLLDTEHVVVVPASSLVGFKLRVFLRIGKLNARPPLRIIFPILLYIAAIGIIYCFQRGGLKKRDYQLL